MFESIIYEELEDQQISLSDKLKIETVNSNESYEIGPRVWFTVVSKSGQIMAGSIVKEDESLTDGNRDVNLMLDCLKLFLSEDKL